MSEELQELHEHAEHAQHEPRLAPVSLTMAILAVLVATVTLLGHRTHTEEIISQGKASDQWAYYQAKNIRRHTDQLFADLIPLTGGQNTAERAKLREKYHSDAGSYGDELKEIESEARHHESETAMLSRRADRFDLGEVFLEVALVVTSITLLTRNRMFWSMGTIMAAIGIVLSATGFLIH